ncbi:MobQ family relaxase [Rubellimicrobium aerolatum]|uniref:MobQ family relaxase n=1 Tax=Rubellimicrobium aerolatum TaxID=490979 RepID=A0ABW0SGX5_9RHOB|nr:MobQ family relaxase [Rubellimicrobium aerolatum]MBP1807600.1 hypothetical protein [Rubellimicrobium aerolatum]
MASYHLDVKSVQRSAGRSATAAIAYRTAERIECQREGRVHDYRAKAGVEASFIVAPEDAPVWAQDRQALWNAAEARETRVNSVTAREWELALPHELDGAGRRELAHAFARELVARYRVAADVAIHAPHREGDQRNWHAHVLTTTRELTAEGLTDKTRQLDAKQTRGAEVTHMRERWAEMQNRALERAGHEERVDHRSLQAQRKAALERGDERTADNLDRAPEVKLGPVVSSIERREERAAEREGREYVPLTERGAQVHEARAARSLLAELGRVRDALREQVRERAQAARETYSHAREEGADRVSAGLAALRAAAQRQGIGQEQGRGREVERESIEDRLARLRERGPERAHGAGAGSIEEGLARLRERGTGQGEERTAEATREAARQLGPGHGLEDTRERLQRILEQESQRAHEGIRERLNEALGRAKPVERERPGHGEAHEREKEALRHGQRARGQGHGWGL